MPDTRTQDGSVAADISRGAVHLLREHTGRGPTKARTVISEDTIAIVLGDTLTKGERSFVVKGERQHVLHTRDVLQQLMRDEWVQLVERLSGRTVEAFFSDDHIDPDYAVEFFLLQPVADGVNPTTAGGAEPPAW
jgi:uncharacterized protein YbcI